MSLFFTGTAISRPCFNFFHCLAAKLIKGIIHKLIHEMSSESIKPVKFMFSKKAIKIDEIFSVSLTLTKYKCQIDGEDLVNFCGLLRKYELYQGTNELNRVI